MLLSRGATADGARRDPTRLALTLLSGPAVARDGKQRREAASANVASTPDTVHSASPYDLVTPVGGSGASAIV